MDCKLSNCPYLITCQHRDQAEFCAWHRDNYSDIEDDFRLIGLIPTGNSAQGTGPGRADRVAPRFSESSDGPADQNMD